MYVIIAFVVHNLPLMVLNATVFVFDGVDKKMINEIHMTISYF